MKKGSTVFYSNAYGSFRAVVLKIYRGVATIKTVAEVGSNGKFLRACGGFEYEIAKDDLRLKA